MAPPQFLGPDFLSSLSLNAISQSDIWSQSFDASILSLKGYIYNARNWPVTL